MWESIRNNQCYEILSWSVYLLPCKCLNIIIIAFPNMLWCSGSNNLFFSITSFILQQVVFKRTWICCELVVQRDVWIWIFVKGSGNELQDQGACIQMYYTIPQVSQKSLHRASVCHCVGSETILDFVDPCKWWTAVHVQVSPRHDSSFHKWWPNHKDSCL